MGQHTDSESGKVVGLDETGRNRPARCDTVCKVAFCADCVP